MQAIERNLARHGNGTIYLIVRRNGRLHRLSLKTKDLNFARQLLREVGIERLLERTSLALKSRLVRNSTPGPEATSPTISTSPTKNGEGSISPTIPCAVARPDLATALDDHDRHLVLMSHGTREMAHRGNKTVRRFCKSWETFSSVAIWNAYRQTGIHRHGKELSSAANHLRWYLRKFVPWAVEKGYLPKDAPTELKKIPRIKVNPRQIRVTDSLNERSVAARRRPR